MPGEIEIDGVTIERPDRSHTFALDPDELIREHLARDDIDQTSRTDSNDATHGSGSRNPGSAPSSATSI